MAAFDTFQHFNESLRQAERELLRDLTRRRREELLAARSEDARVRLVEDFIQEVHNVVQQKTPR